MFRNVLFSIFLVLYLYSCEEKPKTNFSAESLSQTIYKIDGTETTIDDVLNQYKGENVMIDIWASWCADCIKSLPKIENFQAKNPDVKFVFISVDDEENKWKSGVKRYMKKFNIQGEQYHFKGGWDKSGDNTFIDFIKLNWIPRFILVGDNGEIKVFNAKSINNKNISKNL